MEMEQEYVEVCPVCGENTAVSNSEPGMVSCKDPNCMGHWYIKSKSFTQGKTKLGGKDDFGKTRWSLLIFSGLKEVVKVREKAISKYGNSEAWREPEPSRFFDAALRHILKYSDGSKYDDETGLNHLAHVICNLMFVLAKEAENDVSNLFNETIGRINND